jgi:hypothetical protein
MKAGQHPLSMFFEGDASKTRIFGFGNHTSFKV